MQPIDMQPFEATGFSVRTNNAAEMNPSTGNIMTLWDNFYANMPPHFTEASQIYGVYDAYASDKDGDYTVTACATHLNGQPANATTKLVPEGRYLKFSGKGELPAAVISTWQAIWQFFETSTEFQRAYTTDYECYVGAQQVDIYIAIQ